SIFLPSADRASKRTRVVCWRRFAPSTFGSHPGVAPRSATTTYPKATTIHHRDLWLRPDDANMLRLLLANPTCTILRPLRRRERCGAALLSAVSLACSNSDVIEDGPPGPQYDAWAHRQADHPPWQRGGCHFPCVGQIPSISLNGNRGRKWT